MEISLTPELEEYVNGRVQSGLYHSASEVVRAGLRLLREKDEVHHKLQALRREIQVGIDQAERGQISSFDEQTLEEIEATGRKLLAAEQKSNRRN